MTKAPRKTTLESAAALLGRKGGQAKSEAKTRAARANARKRWKKEKGNA